MWSSYLHLQAEEKQLTGMTGLILHSRPLTGSGLLYFSETVHFLVRHSLGPEMVVPPSLLETPKPLLPSFLSAPSQKMDTANGGFPPPATI